MGHKQEALDEIIKIARSHGLSLHDIATSLQATVEQDDQKSSGMAAKIFGYIGGILIFGGVAVLINMQWDSLSALGRVLITLIPGLISFLFGIYCTFDKRIEKAATPLFLLAAVIEPTGILVALKEYAQGNNPAQGVLFMCFVMLLQQGLVFLALRRTALALTTIVFGLNFLATAFDMQTVAPRYIGIIIGGMELCIAYALDKSQHRSIAPINYFFGSIIFLSAYGSCIHDTPFELTFLGMTCLFIYISILARSRVLLSISALAMLGFIGYYSDKYFAHTIGWPVTLIVGGGFMTGLGVVVIKLNNKYITQRHSVYRASP